MSTRTNLNKMALHNCFVHLPLDWTLGAKYSTVTEGSWSSTSGCNKRKSLRVQAKDFLFFLEERSTREYNLVRVQPRYNRKRPLEQIWDKRSMYPDVINSGVGALDRGKVSVIS